MKTIEMTGSPKSAGFKTKATFLEALSTYGYQQDKMKKRNNPVDILVTNDPDSTTSKMTLASDLGVEIMTYEELVELFDLEGDV
jgi:hypothetical protein